jgi:hypothetical protein
MAKEYYDRYQDFKVNGGYKVLPFIKIPEKQTDKKVVWKSDRDRMDKLSNDYYGNPFHGFLIMLANPKFGGVEDAIPDREIIRIPFPFVDTLQQYIEEVERYQYLYGE